MNIVNIIANEVKAHLSKLAIVDCDRKISYEDLLGEVNVLKSELVSLGMKEYKKVGLFFEDSLEYIIISLAVLSCDCAIVPISPSLALDEVENVITKIDIDYLMSSKKTVVVACDNEVGQLNCCDKFIFIYQRESKPFKDFQTLNPAFIRFSSGTTSASKGVVISHESIYDRTNAANQGLNIMSDDNIVWVLSMNYHFVVTIILFLRKAATIILCEQDFPFVMLDAFNKFKCTFMYAAPFHYRMMMNSVDIKKENLRHLRMAISTAVGFSEKEIAQFHDLFGIEIGEAFGIIEIGLPFVNMNKEGRARGSVGKILSDYQIQIRDQDKDGIGVICLKGKGMFDAYYSPWKIREQVLEDGWFNTGDLGYLDAQGFLYIRGREKNVINFAGMKIFPEEVEEVLNSYSNIQESFVYGVAHAMYGQLPKADIILIEPEEERCLIQKLRKFCYDKLSSYKTPKEIRIVSEIKKTQSGKILRTKFG